MRTAALDVATPSREAQQAGPRPVPAANRRRFTIAACTGLSLAAIPYVWVLWDGQWDPLHRQPGHIFTNFYDLQARALFHGRWNVPRGTLGIEGFIVGGKEYMYFPPFPAVLRMPLLAITSRFDGRLTAPSMLLAWLVTALFSALLFWRIRHLVRGPAYLSRAEAVASAVVLGSLMSGSALLYLAAQPWVYNEAFAWGAAMTVGALFTLLGVIQRPSTAGVLATGALTLGAVLSRTTIGWGCVFAVVLTAAWFFTRSVGERERGWSIPLTAAGLVPLAAGSAITWAKFGTVFMHPLRDQVWTTISAHRRYALAANGGSLLNLRFAPSTLLAYLRPDGLRLSAFYPFITLPATPPKAVGAVVIDQTYRTASITASMPLLFVLGLVGLVTVFRRRPPGQVRLARIPLLGAIVGTAGVLFYGYIAPRYLSDFVPLLILAGAVGLTEVWRRLDERSPSASTGVVAVIAALAVFGLAANLGITTQVRHLAALDGGGRTRTYVERQRSIGNALGLSLTDRVAQGSQLPNWRPADQLFIVGKCTVGLYIATGEHESPQWIPVEQGPAIQHRFSVTYRAVDRGPIPLVTIGSNPPVTVWMQDRTLLQTHWLSFRVDRAPRRSLLSHWAPLVSGSTMRIDVITDTVLHRVSLTVNGQNFVEGTLQPSGSVVAHASSSQGAAPVVVTERSVPTPSLCQRLLH